MTQFTVNAPDTLYVMTGLHAEYAEQERHSALSNIANWFSDIICSCSQSMTGLQWFDTINIAVAALIILFFISVWMPKVKIWLIRHLKIQAFIIWTCGVILYMVGFNEHGSATSNIALLLRSCLSSMEMFVSHSDLIEVRHELHGNATYMALFSLTHFCAVAISAIFILRLFGFRLLSWVKALWLLLQCRFHEEHNYHVMFGINANTISLASSIHLKDPKNNSIIFIDMPENGHSHSATRFSFSHFFHSDSNGIDTYLEDIESMDALLFHSSFNFSKADMTKDKSDVFSVFKYLDFSWTVYAPLQRLLRNAATNKSFHIDRSHVNFFFLSDKEDENIAAIVMLQKLQNKQVDQTLFSLSCYCHARKSRDNSAMLNDGPLAFKIHIIDTSNLAVMHLKKNHKYHPVNFVEKDTEKGTVTSAFTGMVIGFGETGRDAFRFLYEFSSFTKDNRGIPSEKKIHIIDQQIDMQKADFLNEAPALKGKADINWWDVPSTHSEAFWNRLSTIINSLNYVVISVKDDDEAADIATSIFEYAYRHRADLHHFNIFVRLRNSMRTDYLRHHEEFFGTIIPFGSNKEAFTYDVINTDVLEKEAKRFKYRYDMLTSNFACGNEEVEAEAAWLKRRLSYITENDAHKRKEKEIKVWYQEEQDRSNAWHIYTKTALANSTITSATLQDKAHKLLLHNLSNCEHLRWNAKMELLGFEPATKDDISKDEEAHKHDNNPRSPWRSFQLRRHECLANCQALHSNPILASTIPYDVSAVILSFEINEEKNQR